MIEINPLTEQERELEIYVKDFLNTNGIPATSPVNLQLLFLRGIFNGLIIGNRIRSQAGVSITVPEVEKTARIIGKYIDLRDKAIADAINKGLGDLPVEKVKEQQK